MREAAPRPPPPELQSLSASREASLATLKADIGELGRARCRKRAEAASREAEAEEEVGRWLGGPYSIPTYIVMCESGGNYSAAQPLQRRRRRLPDPALDLGTLRRPGRTAERPEGRTGPDRRRNLGRLRRQRLGLRRLNAPDLRSVWSTRDTAARSRMADRDDAINRTDKRFDDRVGCRARPARRSRVPGGNVRVESVAGLTDQRDVAVPSSVAPLGMIARPREHARPPSISTPTASTRCSTAPARSTRWRRGRRSSASRPWG